MSSSHVVEGEAPESDSDVEIATINQSAEPKLLKLYVVPGEGPESDDDPNLATPDISEDSRSTSELNVKAKHKSLLHQKLWECNVSLRSSIESLVKHTIGSAEDKLAKTDKSLLDVQELMRSTHANLTLARAKLKHIHTLLDNANCSSALNNIKSYDPL